MHKPLLKKPSPAFVISLIALFVALGGTTYAATSPAKNSVGTAQLKKNAVTSSKIRSHAVTAVKINPKGLTVADALHATSADSATDANELGGLAASDYVSHAGTPDLDFQLGHANWEPLNSTDPVTVNRASNDQGLTATVTGSHVFRIDAAMPTALYGTALDIFGVPICYDTTPGNSIAAVYVEDDNEVSSAPGNITVLDSDLTTATGSRCTLYSFPNFKLTYYDQISVVLYGNWTTAGTTLYLGRVTAFLVPSS
jgi:hypothetical protein